MSNIWRRRNSTPTADEADATDSSGARKLMCIGIIGASNRRYTHIGDVIVAVIKEDLK
ncbi:hypothetical protein YC2023_117333 [Brassica napus]